MDREKVIKGLEICTSRPCYCTDCPYKKECCLDSQNVMEDALALLKEQEAEIETLKQTCCDRNAESTGFCSEAKEEQKIVRGKRANWVGFVCDEGVLWINFLEGKQKLERYDE